MAKSLRIAIVGSGLGGAVLADRLAGHHDVTLFERGSMAPSRPEPPLMTAHPFGLYPSFMYGLGGTTSLWQGGLVELTGEEMGDAWPGALKRELPRWYDKVVRLLHGDGALKAWRDRPAAEWVGDVVSTQLFYPPVPFRAARSGLLSMARLRTGHLVERIEERPGGVDVVSRAGGKTVSERFDRVVIAAGGLNSPLLLQRSGLGGPQVGRNFTDHPMGFVAKLKAAKPSDVFAGLRRNTGLYARSESMLKLCDRDTGLWSAFYLRPGIGSGLASDPYVLSFKLLTQTKRFRRYLAALPNLRDPDFLWQALEHQLHVTMPSAHAYVLVLNEQEATGQGSVREDGNGRLSVDWQISDSVVGAIGRNLERLAAYTGAELLLPKGAARDRLWSGAHYSGTCRISPDRGSGVVDQDLRVHGSEHVYVCDGSVLPSTGASNTGLTIAALVYRLAESLIGEGRTRGAAPKPHRLVISGATGAVGRMMRARLAELPFDWCAADLRDDPTVETGEMKGAVLLHLANAHGSVAENIRLQERAAALAESAGIDQVIVPMSTATLEALGPTGPTTDAVNLGFAYHGHDPYPEGKLAAERFWLAWQAAKPGRRLALVYIPTITGPRSRWTETIANHAPGKTLIVPQLEHFLSVSEEDLVAFLSKLAQRLDTGVSRHLVLSSERPLAETIAADRGAVVKTVRLPGFAWALLGWGYRYPLLRKALSAMRVVSDRLLRASLGYAILPVSPNYLHVFRDQSEMAAKIDAVATQLPVKGSTAGIGVAAVEAGDGG